MAVAGCPPWRWIPASLTERRQFVILAGKRGSSYRDVYRHRWKPSLALDSGIPAGTTAARHPRGTGIPLQGCMPPSVEALPGTGFRRPCRNDGSSSSPRDGGPVTRMYTTAGGSPPWRWVPASLPERRQFVIPAGRGSSYRDVYHRRWKPSLALDSGVPAGTTAARHPRREAAGLATSLGERLGPGGCVS